MPVAAPAPPSPPQDFRLFISSLALARELTAVSEAPRTWDVLDLATGPSAPPAHLVPPLITELQEVLRTLVRCSARLLVIHRKAVESGQAEESAMEDALVRAQQLLSTGGSAGSELGYLRLLAATAEAVLDLAGDTP
ncbi:hypothetical protein BX286_6310 [Streptomyces sp. 3211.6]|uniref:hypothetical protein n=1 Tax=Streptomyces sp. 3211.6 TaxID=1938845 RepID=UPI000EABDDD5|nr:hypothetical protein [Streptomyces sp. 3211.6]RKT08226.1 hypothetical protein BX286_6310 [Streptomyces sp. 3211.6]